MLDGTKINKENEKSLQVLIDKVEIEKQMRTRPKLESWNDFFKYELPNKIKKAKEEARIPLERYINGKIQYLTKFALVELKDCYGVNFSINENKEIENNVNNVIHHIKDQGFRVITQQEKENSTFWIALPENYFSKLEGIRNSYKF